MKLLILDIADDLPARTSSSWDMIVDCARAPAATYEAWRHRTGAHCLSIFEFAQGFPDLRASRELLCQGLNAVVDADGVDWWDVLFLLIEAECRQVMLAHRFSRQLPQTCEIYATRKSLLAAALAQVCGRKLHVLPTRGGSAWRKISRYAGALERLDPEQLAQAVKDKFDPLHSIRRRLGSRIARCTDSVILIPSAYINVSRMGASYAAGMQDQKFLLVCARESAQLSRLPANITQTSLNPYFQARDVVECAHLQSLYDGLTHHLADSAPEFMTASAVGLLARLRSLLPWGLAIRDSWKNLLDAQPISGVLCADDSNPYSRLPLILSRHKGLPAIACHHGALDFRMAVKEVHSDYYLTKCAMENDYLQTGCQISREKLIPAYRRSNSTPRQYTLHARQENLFFFSEPLANMGWREEDVLGNLLPRLRDIAKASKLKLVLKLHPFESSRACRKMLRKFFPEADCPQIVTGPMSEPLWNSTRVAVTVQSSIAVECAARGIPVFLCGWLADPYSGYAAQFAKFGVGQQLESANDLSNIPDLIRTSTGVRLDAPHLDGSVLERLFSRESLARSSVGFSA